MNNRDEIILKKIVQYSGEVKEIIDRFNLTYEVFTDDFVVRHAVSMCVLQIGELVGNLSDGFKTENNAMPWREIKAMRNIAAHNYGEIDIEILWETATGDIPELKKYCEKFI